ncbi:vacuolar protein sorting-associated protein, putative (DUF1162) isoform X2 [Tasmannia lanceolata]|uniref:vacuolar protein sorting-associated protein, putative (DUF1162) isoform X2 n=2 Tax=Tasmannia lanceolata TaxID=3420 RepID=UPI004062DED3
MKPGSFKMGGLLNSARYNNQAGQSFISYISAKILDSIQVSIRDVHVQYTDKQSELAQFTLGLRFSSLTIMTDPRHKQNSVGSSTGKLRGGQVNKIVEILNLSIYCNTYEEASNLMGIDNVNNSQLYYGPRLDFDRYDYILMPFDVTVSLMVNKSGKLENGVPQYAVSAELTELVVLLNEIQLQQILLLSDYLCTCVLREKYGRYWPWHNPLSRKLDGWQKMWWHYAQESILSEVRRKLRKTSWSNLGKRISCRHKYVKLYKKKLDFLRQYQPIDENTIRELEEMEKESEIDDILNYRSIAECQLQEFLSNSTSPSVTAIGVNNTQEKQQNGERSSSRPRGWLNWLSLGMLGAGGTIDSSQFAGAVSDEDIKDIFEATKFHPVPSFDGVTTLTDSFLIKLCVRQITATFKNKRYNKETIRVTLDEVSIECKLWEGSATILFLINFVEMVDPCTMNVVLVTKKAIFEESSSNRGQPFIRIHIKMSPVNRDTELSIKVELLFFEVTYDSNFLLGLLHFHHVLGSVQFQHDRVLSSLSGFENFKVRLFSKAEYIFRNRTKVIWNIALNGATLKIPWRNSNSDSFIMVLDLGALLFRSTPERDPTTSTSEDRYDLVANILSSTSMEDMSVGFQLKDLYDHFEIDLTLVEVSIIGPDFPQAISLFERFNASITIGSCVLLEESTLKQLEVHCIVSSLGVHFSPSIYDALVCASDFLGKESELVAQGTHNLHRIVTEKPYGFVSFKYSVSVNLEHFSLRANLEDDADSRLALDFALDKIDIQYNHQDLEEYWVSVKTVNVNSCTLAGEPSNHLLCSSRHIADINFTHQHVEDVEFSVPSESERSASAEGCFLLHYQAKISDHKVHHNYRMCLNDVDVHCYPRIFGLLLEFYDRISRNDVSSLSSSMEHPSWSSPEINCQSLKYGTELQKYGFSNYFEIGSAAFSSIPLDRFPFVTICNSGSLVSLERSLVLGIPEWRQTYCMKDRRPVRSHKFSAWKKSRLFTMSTMKASTGIDTCMVSGIDNDTNLFVIDLKLNGIRGYFHDSSCILGTVTLPVSNLSVFFHGIDCWDIFGSVDGLTLTSPWSTPNIHEFIWGPALPNISPVLNIRLRKGKGEGLFPKLEICIGIQQVCCILSPDFLAILIGYFSLPDWNLNRNEMFVAENHKNTDVNVKNFDLIYKFEILDSSLISALENNTHHCLQLGLQQLYCSFIPMGNSEDLVKGIPDECVIPTVKAVDRAHLVNVFGRGISLSFMLPKDEGQHLLKFDPDINFVNIPLIAPLDADLWVRLPCKSKWASEQLAVPTFSMMRVDVCQVMAEDEYFFCGVEEAMSVIDELSKVGRKSQWFTSDVLHFMQLKRSLQESNAVLLEDSNETFTEVRFSVKSLAINLYRSRRNHSMPSELITKADMQLKFTASFINEIPLNVDMEISGLVLFSFYSCVTLLASTTKDSISSGLNIHFSKSDGGENVILLAMPSFDIWLHLSDWSEVINLVRSFKRHADKTSFGMASSKSTSSGPDTQNTPEPERIPSFFLPDNFMQASVLIVKSEKIAISFHFPLLVDEVLDKCWEANAQQEMPWKFCSEILGQENRLLEAKYSKSLAFTLHSRYSEVVISGRYVKLKSSVEKIKGMLEVIENQTVNSLPFFQILQLNVAAEICEKEKSVHVYADVQLETFDVWLSDQIFYFWHGTRFKIPETASSQIPIHAMVFKAYLRKASLLLNDGRWSFNGPVLEIFLRNLLVHGSQIECAMEGSVEGDLQVNYNNIHKVMWEPFIEPWGFQLKVAKKHLSSPPNMTDIHLKSTVQLNLNITEPLIEALFRVYEMIKDYQGQSGTHDLMENRGILESQAADNVYTRRYAPYILQNETNVPLSFWVSSRPTTADDIDFLAMRKGSIVQPGSSFPIYIDETPEELFHRRPVHSSERLNEKKLSGMAHHMISIQLDGTSGPSVPMSMDLVGLGYFEVDFSNTSDIIEVEKDDDASRYNGKIDECRLADRKHGFVVPVVFDVSIQNYSKLIRLYSTVILLNATSMPLELRFDIPFGVSPKVLDPIYPGQEFPLPVHLAEAGRMRWRPLGTNYLWSEAHPLSNILSQENRLGFLRSFVCYPSHPSSDPFRCCISIQDVTLPSSSGAKNSLSCHARETARHLLRKGNQRLNDPEKLKKHIIRQVRLTTPLLVKNYLPKALSLTVESGGVTRSLFISEVDTAFVFHIDSTHDLGITFHMDGFRPAISKFPRAEMFTAMAKLSESKFSFSETLTFHPDESNGPICITLEKTMDAFCGARELCVFVPFLLYNCTGLSLKISDCVNEKKANTFLVPSCYNLIGDQQFLARKYGLQILSSEQMASSIPTNANNFVNLISKNHTISLRENSSLNSLGFLSRQFPLTASYTHFLDHSSNHVLDAREGSSRKWGNANSQLNLSINDGNGSDLLESGSRRKSDLLESGSRRKVKAYMYAPPCSFPASDLMVRLGTYLDECETGNSINPMWSMPFFLSSASGSTSVAIPRPGAKPGTTAAFIISVTSTPVVGSLVTRTRAITFQPRYVISNACSKELCFKQKGTNSIHSLGVGQHSHLHWADTQRELLVSIRFNDRGWQWSGSFPPDQLGDTQVKMRNYVSGALNMVRVEVQNAGVSSSDEKIVSNSNGNTGTYLILLSDDNTGFMPYKIENLSMERLRIYQQKCETFETTVHPCTSCPYAWDEPCCPHRLVIEVPGERVLGSYSLDDVREYSPVYLPSTSEKPERRLFFSTRAERAIKVLSIISNYHIPEDMKEAGFPGFKEKKQLNQKEIFVDFSERITIHLSFIGISLINSSPQELVFACAKDTRINLLQSVDQQKLSIQISSLQIDNQLRNTPYPVILSFDHEPRGNSTLLVKTKEDNSKTRNENVSLTGFENTCEPIFCLAAAKWRNKESSLLSFEHINIRLAPIRIEFEELVLLSLVDFVRTVNLNLQSRTERRSNSELQTMDSGSRGGPEFFPHVWDYESMKNISSGQFHSLSVSQFLESHGSFPSLPSVVPIGAPWQQIFLLARRQKKIYVEVFNLAPVKLTVSFSSTPWMLRSEGLTAPESLVLVSSAAVQRGLMALVDVEGAPVYLRQLTIAHHMASWESIQEILIRHYTRQLLHEMYKVFGSAGVIGNPMGFARNVGLGIKDFLSVPAKGASRSPVGLFTGIAQGTKSLVSNTVYAISNAATQFSKSAHKGIVAFTFDELAVAKIEQQKGLDPHSNGVLNEFLEGLTGLLQSPIKGAERHGLPGVLSGIALGTAGLVARPMASILEVTGKTAQSIRNRFSPHQPIRSRIRFPRPVARELPLLPYSWEEAIGISMLLEAGDSELKNEIFVMCKALKQPGKFIIITERLVLVFKCSSLVGFGTPEFRGVANPEWVVEVEMGLEGVIHIDREEDVVNIVGSSTKTLPKQHHSKGTNTGMRRWVPPTSVPIFQTSVALSSQEEAEDVLQTLWSTIEYGKEQHWGVRVLRQCNIR